MQPRDSATTFADVVTTAPALLELRAEWSALWRRCPGATPFQSPHWLLPWWRHLGEGALRVMALRSASGRLVGLAPCAIATEHGGERVLRLLGTGVSDYNDVLVESGFETELLTALHREADAATRTCDRIDFQQLPAWSSLLGDAAAAVRHRTREITEQVPCPNVRLSPDVGAPLAAGWRSKLDYDRRRLARHTSVIFERADRVTVDEHFRALVRLHEARWATRGGGVLATPGVRAFHAEAARELAEDGALRLYSLRAGDTIVASYYGFRSGSRAYYYLGGFAPEWERFGVGNLIVAHAMSEAAREGAAAFDFLRGCESYKYRWGARDEPTFRLRVSAADRARSATNPSEPCAKPTLTAHQAEGEFVGPALAAGPSRGAHDIRNGLPTSGSPTYTEARQITGWSIAHESTPPPAGAADRDDRSCRCRAWGSRRPL